MLSKVRKQARKDIESLYEGTCSIIEHQSAKDLVTKRSINEEVILLENQPCRLSYKTITKASEGNVSEIVQIAKLFLNPDISVKTGSKIAVTQHGKTMEFKNSGEPAIHSNHQEIILDLFDRWS